jgi:hypothetical protein
MLISQAARELVANTEPGFFFGHNPRWFIERFLRTTWLNEIPAEPARWTLMDEIFVKLSGLRPGVKQDIKVCGYNYSGLSCFTQNPYYREDQDCPSIFAGPGFHNFVKDLLRCFYPALRKCQGRLRCIFDGDSAPNFIYGHGRDKSPLLPRLIATNHSKTHITFLANGPWIRDRQEDLLVSSGRGNLAIAMCMHARLGRESPMHILSDEILHKIVKLLA